MLMNYIMKLKISVIKMEHKRLYEIKIQQLEKENKELKFSYKTFEDLAKGFNLLFKRDKKTKPKFKATDFYIKDISEDKNSYTRLNKITDSGELINLIFNASAWARIIRLNSSISALTWERS